MSQPEEKVAAQVVGLAKRKAAAAETASLLIKAAERGRRRRLLRGTVALVEKMSCDKGDGMMKRTKKQKGKGKPIGKATATKHGWKPGEKSGAFGLAADEPVKDKQRKPGEPSVPPPAQMKNTKPPKPKKVPPPITPDKAEPYMKASEELLVHMLIKAAERTKTNRKAAYKHAATKFAEAVRGGNKAHIKKAVAHLAGIMTFDEMTKEGVSAEIGSAIMRMLSKITPYFGSIAKRVDSPKVKDLAERAMQWGEGLGGKGQRVKGMLESAKAFEQGGGNWLQQIMSQHPEAIKEMALAKRIGTGTLAGAGGLAAGRYMFPSGGSGEE